MGHNLFDPAQLRLILFDNIKAPAVRLGVTLIHAQQVTGKKRSLFTTRSGTYFYHRRA